MRKLIAPVVAAFMVSCGGNSTTVTPSSTPPSSGDAQGGGTSPGGGGPTMPGGGGGGGGTSGGGGGSSGGGDMGGGGGSGGGGDMGGGGTGSCAPMGAPVMAGGLTWSREATGVSAGAVPTGALWQPAATDIYGLVSGALVHSAGDGCWSPVAIAGVDSVSAVGGTSSNDVYVIGAGGGNAVAARSTDGGHSWTTHTLSGTTPSRLSVVVSAGTTAWVGWDANQDILRSNDGFATTQSVAGSLYGGRLFAGAGALFDYGTNLNGRTCTIDRSTDGGQTWTHYDGSLCGSPFYASMRAMTADGASLWVLGSASSPNRFGSDLYRSTDGGVTWTHADTGLLLGDGRAIWQSGAVVYASVDHVIADSLYTQTIGERVIYSSDGGATFAPLSLPTDHDEAPLAVSGSGAKDVLLLEPDGTVWHGR